MLFDVVEVQIINEYVLYLRFEDGAEGKVDISHIVPFKGIFSALTDKEQFNTVHVNRELGTIVWDNGADLSPEFLYSVLKKPQEKP